MKKKLFFGISLLTIYLAFSVTKLDSNVNNGSGLLISNIEAYASDSEGGRWKCYGPKPNDHCLCENDVECRDLKGCR